MNRSEKLIIEAVESATGVSDIIRKTRKREMLSTLDTITILYGNYLVIEIILLYTY